MRIFGQAASADLQAQVRKAANEVYEMITNKKAVTGAAVAMDDADAVILYQGTVMTPVGRLMISETLPAARPPFEWLMEITSDVGEVDYFKHYLIRDDDIVLAHRKVLTPIDDVEARVILADLALAREALTG